MTAPNDPNSLGTVTPSVPLGTPTQKVGKGAAYQPEPLSPDAPAGTQPGYKWTQESHDALAAGLPGGGVDKLTQLAYGNPNLVTSPNLLGALASGSTTPEQAGAINGFLEGLNLQKQVELSRASGVKMQLNDKQTQMLDAMSVPYADVNQTAQQAQDTLAGKLQAQGLEVAKDQNGNPILQADGTPLLQKAAPAPAKKGWSFLRVLGDVGSALTKGWNVVDSEASGLVGAAQNETNKLYSQLGIASSPTGLAGITPNGTPDTQAQAEQAVRDAGYDPNSFFSMIAYEASGKSLGDVHHLADQWDQGNAAKTSGMSGNDALSMAIQFASNPIHFRQTIEQDPNLSIQQKADKLNFLGSQDFTNMVQEVNGHRATAGNIIAAGSGLDPVKDATTYKLVSAGTDLAASIVLDPTILAGKAFSAERLAQIGVKATDGSIDGNIMRAILTPGGVAGKDGSQLVREGSFVDGVRKRWGTFLDQVDAIAHDGYGSEATLAGARARIQAQFSELAPMVDHFTGANQVLGFDSVAGKVIMGKGEQIKTIEEAGDYLASNMAQLAASQGKAALETSLMPGATSLFGYRAFRGWGAAKTADGQMTINLARLDKATSVLPSADEAISADGRVIAARGALDQAQATLDAMKGTDATFAEGMKAFRDLKVAKTNVAGAEHVSAFDALDQAMGRVTSSNVGQTIRGHLQDAQDALAGGADGRTTLESAKRAMLSDPVLRGQIQNNMVRTGTINGEGFSLGGMIQARNELAVRRLTALLPRNTVFKLDDAQSNENIFRYAQIYMNKGDAAVTAARWANADEATRRALISHLQLQTMHAAGFGYTDGGRQALADASKLLDNGTGNLGEETGAVHLYSGKPGLDIVSDPDLGGQAAHYAIHPDQVIDKWELPNFASLQQNAQRFGIWDRILGRAFTHPVADTLMHGFKMIQLAKPSTFTRNALEGWANAVFRGEAAGGIRAKALGVEVEKTVMDGLKQRAAKEGWSKEELASQIEQYSPLQKRGWLADHIPHLIMGQWYRDSLGKVMGDTESSQYVLKLLNQPGEAKRMMQGYGLQHLMADVDPGGMTSHLQATKDGFGAAQLTFSEGVGRAKIDGYEHAATDGFEGAQKYSRALGIRYGSNPEYSGLLMDAAKAKDGNIQPMLDYIDSSPAFEKKINQMRLSSIFEDENGQMVRAITPEQKAIAREQLIQKQIADTEYLMTGKNGEWASNLEDELRTNGVPDGVWINKNLKGDARPEAVESPTYTAVPLKPGTNGTVNALFEKVDKAYVRLVEDPIQRTTSMPIFLNNYGNQRVAFKQYEQALIDEHGFTPEAADALVRESAMKAAWVKTESMIDDPGLKSQFDIVGRNFFAYSRATQAMIRRWGQAIVQDPTRMVKASLAIQAAEHTGVIWTDENGEPNFTFPGSGAFIHLVTGAMANIPLLDNFMQIPTTPDLTGKVMLSVPGLENPFHLSATPLVNVPFRIIERMVPDHYALMDEIDRTVNGNIGAGQIISQFQPVALKKFFDAFNTADRNGMVASATIGAITNLIAAGHYPPENATTDQQQQFVDNVRINVRNQMFLRAVFGLWSPSPMSQPTNATSGSTADSTFSIDGIHGLESEFKQLLNDMGGDFTAASQLWAAMHPDKLVYTQSKSGAIANKAYLPATIDAMHWTENNAAFIQKYKNVAGYFLPESTGAFSSSAYATQLAVGLRERHSPEEFFNTAMVNLARPEYDQKTKQFDTEIAGAKAAGDSNAVASLTQQRADFVAGFKANNPLYKNQGAVYAVKGDAADNALSELRQVVNDPSVPSDIPKGILSDMIQSWDAYQSWKQANPANTSAQKDARTMMAAAFSQFMSQKAQSVPGLIDLYQGVFRQLDNKLIDLSAAN